MRLKFTICIFLAFMTSILIQRCKREAPAANIAPGAICLIADGLGNYGLIKVIKVGNNAIHFIIYANRYHGSPPQQFDVSMIEEAAPHLNPLALIGKEEFEDWKPVVVAVEAVREEEFQPLTRRKK
ncbi:hypothetical protein [Pseudochryseolinea flava]|uniref:Uncharacterized protein n=1 Tax=Pseudochryseolinea flava TaxID=2059302 RepID=A0A364XV12_9BACT|nr:hypothetical protein [Pseudochryseolinea flava]RAV97797.1 hypothetical protein DQQ10_26865 [Pseudochryseolinea flava]